MAEAVTGKPTPSATARRKRREETGRAFRMLLRAIMNRVHRPAHREPERIRFSDALDCMNPYWDHAADDVFQDDFHPVEHNDLSLHL